MSADRLMKRLGREALAARVRDLREASGLTQDELATRAVVAGGQQYVWKIERGDKYPSVEMLSRLAEVLGVDLVEFMDPATVGVGVARRESGDLVVTAPVPTAVREEFNGNYAAAWKRKKVDTWQELGALIGSAYRRVLEDRRDDLIPAADEWRDLLLRRWREGLNEDR